MELVCLPFQQPWTDPIDKPPETIFHPGGEPHIRGDVYYPARASHQPPYSFSNHFRCNATPLARQVHPSLLAGCHVTKFGSHRASPDNTQMYACAAHLSMQRGGEIIQKSFRGTV